MFSCLSVSVRPSIGLTVSLSQILFSVSQQFLKDFQYNLAQFATCSKRVAEFISYVFALKVNVTIQSKLPQLVCPLSTNVSVHNSYNINYSSPFTVRSKCVHANYFVCVILHLH